MTKTLTAVYSSVSVWELDVDLEQATDWFVMHDVLHVQWGADPDCYQEIEPTYSAVDDADAFKHPSETIYK